MRNKRLLMLQDVIKKREKGGVSFTLEIPEFHVKKGDFVGIVGPSGCGKSTFLDILGLVLRVTHAAVFSLYTKENHQPANIAKLGDAGLAKLRREHIGYILQSGGLLPFLSVKENILLSGRLNNKKIDHKEFMYLVDRLGITEQIDKKPQYLSGGQRQRVAIARAIIHKPSLILADEPTASVDRPTALEIRDQFRELARENNLTVLLVTHDTEMVENDSDRIFTFDVSKEGENQTISRVVAK